MNFTLLITILNMIILKLSTMIVYSILAHLYLPPILVPVVKLKKQYIYKFSKRLNYEKQEEKIHKIVQT